MPQPGPPADPRARTLRNINVALYAGALLLVAAASLFIGIALPAAWKFGGLLLLTALFYGGGLLVHARSATLRPAATAFTGTGLALVPITGLALHLLVLDHAALAWFITSLVGLAAFVHAAARLQSRVLAALALTFLVSTTWSGGAVLNRGLVWYFIFSILLAALATFAAYARPRWLDHAYAVAFRASHRYLVPAVLVASLSTVALMGANDFILLFLVSTGYYAAAFALGPAADRRLNLWAGRATATLLLVPLGAALAWEGTGTVRAVALAVAAQLAAVEALRPGYLRLLASGGRRPAATVRSEQWVLGSAALLLAAMGSETLTVLLRGPAPASLQDLNWALAAALAAVAAVAWRRRQGMFWLPLAGGLLLVFEPFGPAPWRQALGGLLALALVVAVARREPRRLRPVAAAAVRCAAPLLVGAWAAWAAHGFALGLAPLSGGLAGAALRAATLAFTGAWLANAAASAWLAGGGPRHRGAPARPARHAAFFGLSLGAAAVGTVLAVGLDLGDVANGPGRPPWGEACAWVLLAVGVPGASAILRRVPPSAGTGGSAAPPAAPDPAGRGSAAAAPSTTAAPGASATASARALAHAAGAATLLAVLALSDTFAAAWAPEAVLAVGLAYAAERALSPGGPAVRGAYAVAAHGFLAAALLHAADRLGADGHARVALFAATVALGQMARAALVRRVSRGRGIGLSRMTGWAAYALLWLTLLGYAAGGTVDRASVLVQLAASGAYAVVWWRDARDGRRARDLLVLPAVAAAGLLAIVPSEALAARAGGWIPGALWPAAAAVGLLALAAAALLMLEGATTARAAAGGATDRPHFLRGTRAAAVAVVVGLLAAAAPAGHGWTALAAGLVAAALAVFAAGTAAAGLLVGTVAAVQLAAHLGTLALVETVSGGAAASSPWLFPLGQAGAAVVLFAGSVAGGRYGFDDGDGPANPTWGMVRDGTIGRGRPGWTWLHARYVFAGSLLALAVGGLAAVGSARDAVALTGCLFLAVAAVAAVFEWPRRRREAAAEAAAIALAVLAQRAWWVADGPHHAFWMVQYWVLVAAALAGYEFRQRRPGRGTAALAGAAALLSISGPWAVVGNLPAGQVWVLLAFAGLLAFGLVANRRLFVVWGAAGILVAVLWYLRALTFLLLLLLALLIIGLAVWRLSLLGRSRGTGPGVCPQPAPGGGPGPPEGTQPPLGGGPGVREGMQAPPGGGPGVREATQAAPGASPGSPPEPGAEASPAAGVPGG